MNRMNSLFITFEGPDASGKTTQIKLLQQYLQSKGIETVLTREPGGTPISEKIREIILDKENGEMLFVTEALLYAAARAQHVGELIQPALDAGKVVICDRFLDSSLAYQGYARHLGNIVDIVNKPAVAGLEPDLTFLITMNPELMHSRRSAEEEDRMDAQKLDFHHQVLAGYMELARQYPDRIKVIDGERSIEEINAEIISFTEDLFQ